MNFPGQRDRALGARAGFTLVVTCEHAARRVPRRYARLFASARARAALAGHRAWDPGARVAARRLARALGAPLLDTRVTRLLCDANRSPGHPGILSEFSRVLDGRARTVLLERYHLAHRRRVEALVARGLRGGGAVLHVAVHSFAPRLRGETRRADIGLLYDPARAAERRLCARWKALLAAHAPGLRVRRNYPYLGRADGLTKHLRRRHGPRYLGVELELGQTLVARAGAARRRVLAAVEKTLRALLADEGL